MGANTRNAAAARRRRTGLVSFFRMIIVGGRAPYAMALDSRGCVMRMRAIPAIAGAVLAAVVGGYMMTAGSSTAHAGTTLTAAPTTITLHDAPTTANPGQPVIIDGSMNSLLLANKPLSISRHGADGDVNIGLPRARTTTPVSQSPICRWSPAFTPTP
jgi:hypothetical protein